ncbi:MAG TPA: flagellar protein FlgN [Steroidobacteraceae bacterium]|jgi:flagellar biosynthesis/type III secretory pathway chaperone|nr:flagellar protein FlgN [Steroidobacteraceae bacterium]
MSGVQRDQIQPHLQRILAEESRLLAELEGLLQQETDILRGDDVAAIHRIGGARARCVEQLTRLDGERVDACRMLSFGSAHGALEKLFAWADPGASLRGQWLSNLQIARRCRDLNDRNGAIVTVKLGQVRQLLGKLRGTHAPSVYGPKGTRYGRLDARNLGRA